MGYNKEVYDNAVRILQERNYYAKNSARIKREKVIEKCPSIKTYEKLLTKTGARAVKEILIGGVDVKQRIEKLAQESLTIQAEIENILINNGFDKNYMEEKFICSKCSDTGFIDGIMCNCMKILLREQAYSDLNKATNLSNYSFENFDLKYYDNETVIGAGQTTRRLMENIYNYCLDYVNEFSLNSPNIMMIGDTGLGKTHLSLSIAKKVIDKGYGVVYGSVQNFMSRLEKEKFGRADDEQDTEALLLECDLLILDDLGSEFATPFVTSAIYNIINSRLQSGLPTIMNSNMSSKQLEARYSQRVLSRIVGNYKSVKFVGKDIRQIIRINELNNKN